MSGPIPDETAFDRSPPTALEGYDAGRWPRRVVYTAVVLSTFGAVTAGVFYARHREAVLRDPAVRYAPDLAPGEVRPREMHWTNGRARLGLSRTPPSAERIVLPDRIVELAPDASHAQVDVEVRDGRTVRLEVLTGAIDERPVPDPPGEPPPP
ncbi:MAG: hypothetical protein D6705_06130 [Deltaproteobacteria bacterium]|nr:MAG: hypothetical protein D6705_06130 [Deltaproteobacteria bacterium]